jgi:hypothetical protein
MVADAWGRAHEAERYAKGLWRRLEPRLHDGQRVLGLPKEREAYAAAYLVAADAWEEAGEAFRAKELREVSAG